MERANICLKQDTRTLPFEWGTLTWFANAEIGNSTELTVGRCILKAGAENPLHLHPNCSEVLVVLEGVIEHAIETEDLIGMIQPLSNDDDKIHQIGCLGRIDHYQKQSDILLPNEEIDLLNTYLLSIFHYSMYSLFLL